MVFANPVRALPRVSVIIPVLNEQANISACLDCVLSQDYDPGLMEIWIIDTGSGDRTVEIIHELQRKFPLIHLAHQPGSNIPQALNIGVAFANGEIIVRVDARSRPDRNYVSQLVLLLFETSAFHVGGKMKTSSPALLGKVIAYATAHRFGVGNSRYRTSDQPSFQEGGYLGAFWRAKFLEVGGYDPECAFAEDDELSFRLRRMGHRVQFAPEIEIGYVGRSSLRNIWGQFYRYGRDKQIVLRKHGRLPSIRHYVPLAFLLALFALSCLSLLNIGFGCLLGALVLVYLGGSLGFSTIAARQVHWRYFFILPIVFSTLHFSYAFGSLVGAVKNVIHILAFCFRCNRYGQA
jgi:glycosyltransferase involved in cell wall biosynthesis